jgi:DHA1 family tetracycline resistance protein-like MFS transporter
MKPGLGIVYLTVFVDLLGFGIILPLLPFYAERFGATGVWVGAILTAYSAAQLVGASVLGRLSDRVGRRPVLLLSLAGSAVSLFLSGLAHTLWLLLAARGLAGLFGGSIAAAQAFVADVTVPDERAKYMGLLGASIGLGFVFGPAVGALLARYGFGTAAFAAAALAAANLAFAFWRLPETRPASAKTAVRARVDWSHLVAALHHPTIGRLLSATFLVTLGFVAMEATFALLGEARLGLDAEHLGVVFAYVGVVMVLVQGGLVGRLVPRFGERALASSGAVAMAASLGALPFAPSMTVALSVLGVLALGQGLTNPTLSTLLSRASGADEQGGLLGLGQSLAAGARALGPLAAGWLYDHGAAIPYVVSAGLLVGAALMVGSARPQNPAP